MEMPRSPALRAEHPRLLLELSRHVVATLELREVFARSIEAFRRVVPFEAALIRLLQDGALLTAAVTPQGDDAVQVRSPADAGLAGTVVSSVDPVYVADVTAEQAADPSVRALAAEAGVRSYLGIALADGDGFLGVLELGSSQPRAFSRDQIESAVLLAPSVAIAIRNAETAAGAAREPASISEMIDGDFMSVVAHELRTPLAVVLGCAETMAAKAPDLDAAVVEDLSRRTVAAGHRLERLIADLFDMSRLRSGTLTVTPIPTSLRSIVSRAASDAPPSLALAIDVEAGLPLVAVDPNRLVQVLRILLDNAWKHAGEEAEVDIRATRARDGVRIEISDHGPGIAPEVLHRIFDPFVQAEEPMTRSVGGLGIGLYLARGVCGLMGAEIEVDVRRSGGTTFLIHLAAANDALEPVQ
ncbi:MAG: ATP-binding protein [Actinomycetota bacterium]|nr:ATP-binding protein [Actinomycetota bacterium]